MGIGFGILCIVYGDVCLRYRLREKLCSAVVCIFLVRVGVSAEECIRQHCELFSYGSNTVRFVIG